LQLPVRPQDVAGSTGHCSRGSLPSGARTQLPGLAPLQVRQVPVQSLAQQTPSKQ
jgi:hypothetical protein